MYRFILSPSGIESYAKFLKNEKHIPLDFISKEDRSSTLNKALGKGNYYHKLTMNIWLGFIVKEDLKEEDQWLYDEIMKIKSKYPQEYVRSEFQFSPDCIFNEVQLLNGGTTDLIYLDHWRKEIIIIDWKTNRSINETNKKEYKTQLYVYGLLAQNQLEGCKKYKIVGKLGWINFRSKKIYLYNLIFTQKNIDEIKEKCLLVWEKREYITDQKEIYQEKTKNLIEKVNQFNQEGSINIDKIEEKQKLINQLNQNLEDSKKDLKDYTTEVYKNIKEITGNSGYSFTTNNLKWSGYYQEVINYGKVAEYLLENYQIDWNELIDNAEARNLYLRNNIEINDGEEE